MIGQRLYCHAHLVYFGCSRTFQLFVCIVHPILLLNWLDFCINSLFSCIPRSFAYIRSPWIICKKSTISFIFEFMLSSLFWILSNNSERFSLIFSNFILDSGRTFLIFSECCLVCSKWPLHSRGSCLIWIFSLVAALSHSSSHSLGSILLSMTAFSSLQYKLIVTLSRWSHFRSSCPQAPPRRLLQGPHQNSHPPLPTLARFHPNFVLAFRSWVCGRGTS